MEVIKSMVPILQNLQIVLPKLLLNELAEVFMTAFVFHSHLVDFLNQIIMYLYVLVNPIVI